MWSLGTYELTVRLRKTGPDTIPVRVTLLRGDGQAVAVRNFEPGQGVFTNYVFDLTPVEIAAIGDSYQDLQLSVMANPAVLVGCCPNKILEALTATLTNQTGDCANLPESIPLQYQGGYWSSAGLWSCGVLNMLSFFCSGSDCSGFILLTNPTQSAFHPDPGCDCSPLNVAFSGVTFQGCSGSATVTIPLIRQRLFPFRPPPG